MRIMHQIQQDETARRTLTLRVCEPREGEYKMENNRTKTISIRIPESQYRELAIKSKELGIDISTLCRQSIFNDEGAYSVRKDLEEVKQMLALSQYASEFISVELKEYFEYLLMRIPSRELPGATSKDQRAELDRLKAESRKIADKCIQDGIAQMSKFRNEGNPCDDPIRIEQFKKLISQDK